MRARVLATRAGTLRPDETHHNDKDRSPTKAGTHRRQDIHHDDRDGRPLEQGHTDRQDTHHDKDGSPTRAGTHRPGSAGDKHGWKRDEVPTHHPAV
jgi:hypothetical protein